MRIVKTKRKKYPYVVWPTQGNGFYVPSQHKFSNDFVDQHGCSLVGFYIAMSFLGKRKTMNKLLKWSRKHLKIRSKIPLSEVYKGIRKLVPGKKDHVTYRRKVTSQEVRTALAQGYLVLLETKDPLHTNPIMWDDTAKVVRNFSNGRKKIINVDSLVKNQSQNDIYRGCIFIHP